VWVFKSRLRFSIINRAALVHSVPSLPTNKDYIGFNSISPYQFKEVLILLKRVQSGFGITGQKTCLLNKLTTETKLFQASATTAVFETGQSGLPMALSQMAT